VPAPSGASNAIFHTNCRNEPTTNERPGLWGWPTTYRRVSASVVPRVIFAAVFAIAYIVTTAKDVRVGLNDTICGTLHAEVADLGFF